MVYKGHLFKKASKNISFRRVMDSEINQARILEAAYKGNGHKKEKGYTGEWLIDINEIISQM
jgi:hypothetical protein